MEKITVYGLPLTPRHLINELAGASFCVSYATRKDLGGQLEQAIDLVGKDGMLLIDNGAFTMHKKGVSTRSDEYLQAFAAWANEILARCPQAVAVLPDVIGGSEEENCELVARTMGLIDWQRAMPVWHMHESLSYLLYLCESFKFVSIGSSGQYWKIGTPAWHARIKEAFDAIAAWEEQEGEERPRIHMMRAQSMAHLYAFDSSDSSNVAVNHTRYKNQGKGHVERFAKRIDSKIQASAGSPARHQIGEVLVVPIETQETWLAEFVRYRQAPDAPAETFKLAA